MMARTVGSLSTVGDDGMDPVAGQCLLTEETNGIVGHCHRIECINA